ncbi:hypothetical protein J2W22_001269 [Sphingomonas kyeonggiensis]|nr:hypothetical protein [Sphingomonas kyeonggiensis]
MLIGKPFANDTRHCVAGALLIINAVGDAIVIPELELGQTAVRAKAAAYQ